MKKSTKLFVILSFCMFIVSVALVTVLAVTDFGLTANGFIRFGLDENIDVTFSKGHLEGMTSLYNNMFQSFTVNKETDDMQAVEGYQSWLTHSLKFNEDSEGIGRLVFTVINNAPVNSDEHLRVSFSTNTTVNSSISATPSADFCIRPGSSHTFDIEFVAQSINYSSISSSFQIRIDVQLYKTEGMIALDDDGWFIDEDYGTEMQMELDETRHTATITFVENYSEDSMLPHYVTYEGKMYTVNAIDSPIGDAVFYNAYSNISSIDFPTTMTYIGDRILEQCTNLTSISLPRSVEHIGEAAFVGCTNLSGTIMLPPRLKTLGESAFEETNISGYLRIPRGVKYIPAYCFQECSKLTGIALPEGLIGLGDRAFYQCINLSGNLFLPKTLTYIEEYCFNGCKKLTGKLVIPSSVEWIGDDVFESCAGFSGLDLSEGLQRIGARAFGRIQNMQGKLYLPTTLTYIGVEAFYGTNFSGELKIPEGITDIYLSSFCGISAMAGGTLILPSTIESIEDYAFEGYLLNEIIIYAENPPTFEQSSFNFSTVIYIPDSYFDNYANDDTWNWLDICPLSER